MPLPATTVEIAFDTSALSPDVFTLDDPVRGVMDSAYEMTGVVMVDVTASTRAVQVNRGRSRERDDFPAGAASVVLDNRNRYFDPTYTSSPYYGQLVPRREVRVTTGGDRVFTGYVQDWALDFDVSGDATATVQAIDGFSIVSQQELTAQAFGSAVASTRIGDILDVAAVAWPTALRDVPVSEGFPMAAGTATANALTYLRAIAAADGGSVFIDRDGLLTYRSRASSTIRDNMVQESSFEGGTTGWAGGSGTTISQSATWAQFGTKSLKATRTATTGQIVVSTNPDPNATAATSYAASCYCYSPNATRNVVAAITWRDAGLATISQSVGSAVAIGTAVQRVSVIATAPALTAYAEFNFATSAASATTAEDYYIDGVLLEVGTEVKPWFDEDAGLYAFNLPTVTSDVVLTDAADDGTSTMVDYMTMSMEVGTDELANYVTVSGGTATPSSDSASQATYGVIPLSVDGSYLGSNTERETLATWLLSRRRQPIPRFSEASVEVAGLGSDVQGKVARLDLGDVINVAMLPNGVGSRTTIRSIVEGVAHDIRSDRHRITFRFSAPPGD